MTRGQPAARGSQQREVMQTLNPEAMDSLPSAMSNHFDLLADSVSYSQWPTLPLSPTRAQMRGSSFLDGRDGNTRDLGDTLDTLPRGSSYRLVAPGIGVESEFDLLGASTMLPTTETPLLDPAIQHAADACPTNVRPSLCQHHRKAHEPVRTHSITLPQPPEDTAANVGPSGSLRFPPSPASSLLLSSGGATDAYTATQGTGSVESWSKPGERSSSPGPASLPPLPVPPSATTPRGSMIGVLQAPPAHRSFRAHAEEAMAASAAQRREGSAVHRSPVSEATVVSASSESSPPWMSSGEPASERPSSERPSHILTPRRTPAMLRSHTSSNQFETNTNFQSCMSSMISSCTMSIDENSGKLPILATAAGWQMKPAPPYASADKQDGGMQGDADTPGRVPSGVAASANQAWSNPIYSSHSDAGGLDTMASQNNDESGLVSSYLDYNAEGECAENDQNPTNDPSRHQSLALSQTQSQALSQALDGSLEPAVTGDSGVVPDAICSFLNKIDDMEKRISCGWQEEQALRAHEEASLEVVAGKKQLTAEHSGTAASTSSRQPSARSRTASPGPLRIHLESSEAALGSPAQVTLALSGGDAGNTHEPGSPSACETPRNWEEHALELQEELAASQLQSQQDREAFESDLRDLQKQLQHERLLRRNAQAPALDNAGAAEDAARVKTDAHAPVATSIAEPTSDDAAVLVSQAQHSVNKLEEVVSARLESLVTHTADMKGRMEAAQDEARVLREEVQTAESRINALEAELQEAKTQQHKTSTESSTEAFTGTPRSHALTKAQTTDAEMNALLKQLQAADTENTELKESVSKLQGQQAALQALVDDRQGGVGTVSMFEHQKIVSQNKELQAQLQQLRMDLELLYMDEQYNTGAVENDTSMGLGGNSEMNPSGGPTSFMSTVQRLGALLGAPESQRGPQSFMRGRSVMNTLPQLSEHSASVSPENASPHHPARDTSIASSSILPLVSADMTYGDPSGAGQRLGSRGQDQGSPMFAPSSPQAYNGPNPQDASMLDGPGAPTGSVTSMGRSMDRSTLTALREATADRLASTVQNQAGALAERDQQIADLQQRVCELEEAQLQENGDDTCASGSGDENGHAWESLPPPESFKEALEQILLLQVENSRLSNKLAGKLGLPGNSDALSEGISRDKPVDDSQMADASCSVTLQNESYRRRKGAVLMKSVSQARKAMASMHVLAEAMNSVQGQGETGAISFQGESGMVVDGSMVEPSAQDAEMGIFKDMVTRALSDQVVAWQNAHTEVSRDLVAANLRVAEDAMFIEQLKAEHDRLCATIKQLTVAPTPVPREPPTPSTPGRNSSSNKGGRLSFLGRLTTPRHT